MGSAGSSEGVGAELDHAASAGRFGGAVSVVGSGTSALLSSWISANRTLFNARPVGASPTRLADGLSPPLSSGGEEELFRQVHTLFGRNAQVVHELEVQEEVEGVRQEVREVERESKAKRNACMNMNMWMG